MYKPPPPLRFPVKELEGLGLEIFKQRYAYPGEEKWSQRAKVISKHVASAEKAEDVEKWETKFYDTISTGDLVPGGRIIFGSGRNGGRYNLLNCYLLYPDDSVTSIGKIISDTYKISCAGGGIGFNFSRIRPKGDNIQNISSAAPGSISVMRMINEIGEHVRAGGNRRVALMSILDITHPDILEFLHVKLDKKELRNFNISVAITDRFIEACEKDELWYFSFGNRKYYLYEMDRVSLEKKSKINVVALNEEDAILRAQAHHMDSFSDTFENVAKVPLKAYDLWKKIWTNSVESGDPGIFNIDLANRYTNTSYFCYIPGTNPCGEVPLDEYSNCCLGHINLSHMVVDEEGVTQVDWRRLANAVRVGIRFLDDVLTVNHFPIPECREAGHKSRRIGLGVLGYHYLLIQLGIRYGSEKCLEFTERLFSTIRDEAYLCSARLGAEKGSFPAFDYKKFLHEDFAKTLSPRIRMIIKKNGIRNAVMLTQAPTGSVGMVMETSTGIEPIFAAMYHRRWRFANTWKETVVLDPLFKKFLQEKKPLENFVGAYDITPEEHIAVQATIQKYVDLSISKTINLPKDFKAEDFIDKALAYLPYLKGLTIYRAGSKGQDNDGEMEPLSAIPLTAENIKKYANLENVEVALEDAAFCALGDGSCGN